MIATNDTLSVLQRRVTAGLRFATHPDRGVFLSYMDKIVVPALVDVLKQIVLNRHHLDESQKLAVALHEHSAPRVDPN